MERVQPDLLEGYCEQKIPKGYLLLYFFFQFFLSMLHFQANSKSFNALYYSETVAALKKSYF